MNKNAHKLSLTNLDKIYWPQDGYTKGDVINYYESIAPTILPYLKNRPMVLNRHPNGIDHENFFQKNVDIKHLPSWIETISVKHKERSVDYLLVQNLESLLYVANLGCIELNPFNSRINNLENPDYMIIDLDPEDLALKSVIQVALIINNILNNLNIKNYCKTSGKRGLHIFVPLGRGINFNQSQKLCQTIGIMAQQQLPHLISLDHRPAHRQKRIYIDYLRNSRHQTTASVYCLRPSLRAPVSAPLSWEEIRAGFDPRDFNIETMPQRIHDIGDIFKPVLGPGLSLKASLKALTDLLKSL
jgi:bifunctional non-homologous end joining protein LigD